MADKSYLSLELMEKIDKLIVIVHIHFYFPFVFVITSLHF